MRDVAEYVKYIKPGQHDKLYVEVVDLGRGLNVWIMPPGAMEYVNDPSKCTDAVKVYGYVERLGT
jgi:hypothetical protein